MRTDTLGTCDDRYQMERMSFPLSAGYHRMFEIAQTCMGQEVWSELEGQAAPTGEGRSRQSHS